MSDRFIFADFLALSDRHDICQSGDDETALQAGYEAMLDAGRALIPRDRQDLIECLLFARYMADGDLPEEHRATIEMHMENAVAGALRTGFSLSVLKSVQLALFNFPEFEGDENYRVRCRDCYAVMTILDNVVSSFRFYGSSECYNWASMLLNSKIRH